MGYEFFYPRYKRTFANHLTGHLRRELAIVQHDIDPDHPERRAALTPQGIERRLLTVAWAEAELSRRVMKGSG